MTNEQVINLIGLYHHDEGQLLPLVAWLVGTGIAIAALIVTTKFAARTRLTIGCMCAIGYVSGLFYGTHLSHRMDTIRHFLANKTVSSEDVPVPYINAIVGTDWNMVPILMFFFASIPPLILIALYFVERYVRVPMTGEQL